MHNADTNYPARMDGPHAPMPEDCRVAIEAGDVWVTGHPVVGDGEPPYCGGTPIRKVTPMSLPVLLVTGTSSGIGLSTAVAAAGAGFRTVATMRNLEGDGPLRAAAADADVDIAIRQLDVTDGASIDACIDGIIADHGQLNAVVNNAGSGHVGTIENVSLDDVRGVMEVNFFGVVAVTKAAMPHLRASRGRVITVSSVGGAVGQPFNEAYCAAKFAVEGFMESLAPVAGSLGVHVAIVEPGAVTSEFVNNVRVDPVKLFSEAGPYEPALQGYIAHVMAEFSSDSAQTSDEAAEVVLAVLQSETPALRTQTSPWAETFVGNKLRDLDGSSILSMTSSWVS
jgi:NAD(P)-dependent dehydrogenase (short-subunit alcohol dehydrogenase family)